MAIAPFDVFVDGLGDVARFDAFHIPVVVGELDGAWVIDDDGRHLILSVFVLYLVRKDSFPFT